MLNRNMDNLYKLLDWKFDPLLNMDLTRFRDRFTKVDIEEASPDFLNKLNDSNLKLVFVGVFYSQPGYRGSIHVDGILDDLSGPWSSRIKINWTNTETTSTLWFDVKEQDRIGEPTKTNANSDYIKFDKCRKTLIRKSNLKGWHLFESGIPHCVRNYTEEDRWCVSFVVQDANDMTPWPSLETLTKRLCPASAAGEAIILTR